MSSLDKVKSLGNNISEKITGIIEIDPSEVMKKIFDNIVWTIVLTVLLFILIMAYIGNRGFNVSWKLESMDKNLGNITNQTDLDKKSAGKNTEQFDEIDPSKHTLTDVYICSSIKSYLIGRQVLDFCSGDIVSKCVELGARFIDLDIHLNSKKNIVVANGLIKGGWILTINDFLFENFCKNLTKVLFDRNTLTNPRDPIILSLNIHIPKSRMDKLYDIIQNNLGDLLVNPKYNLRNKKNILEAPLKELMGKLIILTSGKIGDTKMMNVTHLRLGDRVRKLTYKQLQLEEQRDVMNFNKRHLTIVVPESGFSSINFNPERAWDYGCQIVCMHFQREDDFMMEYIRKFSEKSYLLKPFEFTKFHDVPEKGYDNNKIAYYDTHELDFDKEILSKAPNFSLGNPWKLYSSGSNVEGTVKFELNKNLYYDYKVTFNIQSPPIIVYMKINPSNTRELFIFDSAGIPSVQITNSKKINLNNNKEFSPIPRLTQFSNLNSKIIKTEKNIYGSMIKKKCCRTIIDIDEYLGKKTEIFHINSLKIKLNKLGILPHEDIRNIEMLRSNQLDQLDFYINKHNLSYVYEFTIQNSETMRIFKNSSRTTQKDITVTYNQKKIYSRIKGLNNNTPAHNRSYLIEIENEIYYFNPNRIITHGTPNIKNYQRINNITNKFYLVLQLLKKQVRSGLEEEKRKLMGTEFKDKCFGKGDLNCEEEALCSLDELNLGESCEKSTTDLPFPKFCVPRHILPNRNKCLSNSPTDKKLKNKNIRKILHDKHTKYENSFIGTWSSKSGIIEIEDKYDEFCEFKFKVPKDGKEFSMHIVDNNNRANIQLNNLYNYNYDEKTNNLFAKGIFVDPKLREIEERNNLPKLKFHGYAEMKMESLNKTDHNLQNNVYGPGKCVNTNKSTVDRFIGVWKYTETVVNLTKYGKTAGEYIFGEENTYDATNNTHACYRMMNADCNSDLQKLFGRQPKFNFDKGKSIPKSFSKDDLPSAIESFSGGYQIEEAFNTNLGFLKTAAGSLKGTIFEKSIKNLENEINEINENEEKKFSHGPIPSGFLTNDFSQDLFESMPLENQFHFLALTSKEREFAIKEFGDDIEKLIEFLKDTPEKKKAKIEEKYMYKTKKGKKKDELFVDLIMDNKDLMDKDMQLDNCMQRQVLPIPGFFRPPLSAKQRNKKPRRHRCNVSMVDHVKPFMSSCSEYEVDTDPYCNKSFIHWIVREHPKYKDRRQIILKEKGLTNKCELEDEDYFLEQNILIKKRDIKNYNDLLRYSKTFRTSPDFEKKKKEINEKIENIKENEVKKAQNNFDDENYAKAQQKIKKLKKELKELKEKIPLEMVKFLNIDIEKTKKELEELEKKLEKRKKEGKYSLDEPVSSLAYGEIETIKIVNFMLIKEKVLTPVILNQDKKRRFGKFKNFRDDWKVLDIPNHKDKYAIITGEGNMALTKKKIEELNRQSISEIYDPKYTMVFGDGTPVSYFTLVENVVDWDYQTEGSMPGPVMKDIKGKEREELIKKLKNQKKQEIEAKKIELGIDDREQLWHIHQFGDVNKCGTLEAPPTLPKDESLTVKNNDGQEDCTIFTGKDKEDCNKRNLETTNQASHDIPENPGTVERPETAFG